MEQNRTRRWAVVAVAALAALGASACQPDDVRALASDQMNGRNNLSAGSARARAYLVDRLRSRAEGANTAATGDAAYLQPFAQGTNVVAVVPGTDRADEYVLVGAHYDHLGTSCPSSKGWDIICNGATDNATGAAAVLAVADHLADHPPSRSVILALWDAEEDGLLGSKHYIDHPLVPLEQTVAGVNVDIQGANLLPGLRNTTFAVGTETGGASLSALVHGAAQRSPLDVAVLSGIFGAGNSDHTPFVGVGVPMVFLTDSAAGCYHTAQDEVSVVDWGKLERQRKMLVDLVDTLVAMPVAPAFAPGQPRSTFDDVRQFKKVIDRSYPDRFLQGPTVAEEVAGIKRSIDAIYAAGPSGYASRELTFLSLAARSKAILENSTCDGYLTGS